MRKNILTLAGIALLYVLPLVPMHVSAQQREKWDVNKAIDFVACSFVRVSLKGKITCIDVPSKEKLLQEIGNKTETQKLANEITGLKEKFKADSGGNDLVSFVESELFSDQSNLTAVKSFLRNRKDRQDEVDALKKAIQKGLEQNLVTTGDSSSNQSRDSATQGTSQASDAGSETEQIDVGNDDSSPEQTGFPWLIFLGGTLLGISLGGTGLYVFLVTRQRRNVSPKHGQRQSGLPKVNESSQSSSSMESASSSKATVKSQGLPSLRDKQFEAKIVELESKVAALEKENQSLKSSVPAPEVSAGYGSVPMDFSQPAVAQPRSSGGQALYFPAPTPEGLFDSRYASPMKTEGESLYMLRLISESEAEVHLDNSKISVNKAKNSPERILDPVCEGARNPMNQILGIRMTAPGKARLEGDDWRVYEKVKVIYEY